MAVFNVRSITTKSFVLNDLIVDHDLDCLFLTETWLGSEVQATLIEACLPLVLKVYCALVLALSIFFWIY